MHQREILKCSSWAARTTRRGRRTTRGGGSGGLEAWTKERFPEAQETLYRWSGMVLETDDGLAFIGRNPGDDNVFIATGDSGMGMTHGTIAGMLLRDLITGRDNPWAALYDPARKPWRAPEEFVKENLNVAAQYTDLLTGGEVSLGRRTCHPWHGRDDAPRPPQSRPLPRRGGRVARAFGHLPSSWAASSPGTRLKGPGTAPATARALTRWGRVINGPANRDLS